MAANNAAAAAATVVRTAKIERAFFRNQEVIDGFKVFDTYMNKKREPFTLRAKRGAKTEIDVYARYHRMKPTQDWCNVWPTSGVFRQSVVPLPVRQGLARNKCENDELAKFEFKGLPPVKYANTELMKIPNFFHLTPLHIKRHCEALKKFCTPFPKEEHVFEEFPVAIETTDYVYDGPNIRDDRARTAKLEINLDSLNLDADSRKILEVLAQDRVQNNILSIETNRCPYRRQNEDYVKYLLRTLYFESINESQQTKQ